MKHYEVRYTDVEPDSMGRRTYIRNCDAHVATTSVERAIELVNERVPDAVIVSVQCRNAHMELIVDDQS